MSYEWIRYQNQGATRNLPLAEDLARKLGFLQQMGIVAEVFSGGQPALGSGRPRVGSTRHDHGGAADVFFYQNGRKLDWANPNDLPVFQDIVRQAKQAGLTGFGAGPGYMRPGSMHIGFGTPGVWGAGGRAANAPEWLRQAFGAASAGPARPTMPASAAPASAPASAPAGTPQIAATDPQMQSLAAAMASASPLPTGGSPIAAMFAMTQRAQEQREAEYAAEQTRRAALFGGPSPFG